MNQPPNNTEVMFANLQPPGDGVGVHLQIHILLEIE